MIRKAVIPAAGTGSRMFPATVAIKKEFLPLVDKDGFPKPAIQILIEEVVNAGIEEVCLIVQPGDEEVFKHYFNLKISAEMEKRLKEKPAFAAQVNKIRSLGERIRFVHQKEQLGFGHAVYQAKDFINGENFLLLLGDQIYISQTKKSCTEQLLVAYERAPEYSNLISLARTSEDFVHLYGCAEIQPPGESAETEYSDVFKIVGFIEKPDIETARKQLVCARLPKNFYFCVFGEYIFSSEIFETLKYEIDNDLKSGGEFQLTSAMDRLCKKAGNFAGFEPKGEYLDIGKPELYAKAVSILAGEV